MDKNSIANKIEEIRKEVTSYINKNMNDDFMFNMYCDKGSKASFKTTEGAKVNFTSYRDFIGRCLYVEIEGQSNQKPFEFNFRSSMNDYGTGTILCNKYGIAFWDVGDAEKEPTIKPFRKIMGIKSYQLGKKGLKEIVSLLEQLSVDIKTIVPDEETKNSLRQNLEEKEESENQQQNVEGTDKDERKENISSQKEELENLKQQLLNPPTIDSLGNQEKSIKK